MSIVQTLLVFVGIPVLVFLLLAAAVFGKSMVRQPNRYRPGKAWDYAPRWYVAHPEVLKGPATGSSTAQGGASGEW